MFSSEPRASTKSERTRELIRTIALASFQERGYDETTVRLVAQEAGVAVGTAYYHFPTKNHLVQELYLEVQLAHRSAAEPRLSQSDDLIERLRIVYSTGLDQLTPYHGFAPGFLSAAVSPRSPVNPLSEESGPARDVVEGLFREAVTGAKKNTLPAEFVAGMPAVLVLGHLLLALFWVYDASPGQERSRRLLDRGLTLFRMALPLTRLPLLRAPLRELLDLVTDVGA